jgi:hypothetical protein
LKTSFDCTTKYQGRWSQVANWAWFLPTETGRVQTALLLGNTLFSL